MKNADRPAAPCKTSENTGAPHYKDVPHNGLTKRENFAAMAMQGILSNPHWADHGDHLTQTVVDASIGYADALLMELEK